MTQQEIDMMEQAANQIDWLTKENMAMATRLKMFDDVMMLVNINTNRGMSHSPGPTEHIRDYINKEKAKLNAESKAESNNVTA